MKLITINGPLGSGKSWVADRIPGLVRNYTVQRVSFQDPLTYSIPVLMCRSHMTYADFKKEMIHGQTGRQWMIDVATKMREFDPTIFSRLLYDSMVHLQTNNRHPQQILFVADSNGFADELDFFKSRTDVDLLTCSIEPLEYRYRRGELYQSDDSRSNLAHKCTIVRPDSDEMLLAIKTALMRRGWV